MPIASAFEEKLDRREQDRQTHGDHMELDHGTSGKQRGKRYGTILPDGAKTLYKFGVANMP